MGTSPDPDAKRGSLLSLVFALFLGFAIGVIGQWFLDLDAGLAGNDVANRVYGLFMAGMLGFAVAGLCFVLSIDADKDSMRQWLIDHGVWVLAGALGGAYGAVAGWAAGTAVDRARIFDGTLDLGLEPSLVNAAEAGMKMALVGASGVAAVGIVVGIHSGLGKTRTTHPGLNG
ncbi:MAG: hypothetical protein H8E48_05715 [Chloroflexi bacterium]|nr:hypothetical protein [Chloroflexota bacterium]